MKPMIFFCATLCVALLGAGCAPSDGPAAHDDDEGSATSDVSPELGSQSNEGVPENQDATATVQLTPTQGNQATGTLTVTSHGGAVHVSGTIQGLKPGGQFGFHFHENGDCSAPDASSAGGHFNPTAAQHGNPQGDARHAGDMPNLQADDQGVAQVSVHAAAVSLRTGSANDVMGKAVVVHEKADDYNSQPAGNSGARIACGVVGA
jgi:superoxide dismutase, Cu-Zn family